MTPCSPISRKESFEYHHGKHHAAYVTNLNKLIEGKAREAKSRAFRGDHRGFGDRHDCVIFQQRGAGLEPPTFYWNSMKPNGGGQPTGGDLLAAHHARFLRLVREVQGGVSNAGSRRSSARAGPGSSSRTASSPSRKNAERRSPVDPGHEKALLDDGRLGACILH